MQVLRANNAATAGERQPELLLREGIAALLLTLRQGESAVERPLTGADR